jgi:hypothetical protein
MRHVSSAVLPSAVFLVPPGKIVRDTVALRSIRGT